MEVIAISSLMAIKCGDLELLLILSVTGWHFKHISQ